MKDDFKMGNEEETRIDNLFEDKKTALRVLLITTYVTFFSFQLTQIDSITEFSFSLHELFYLPVNLAIFLVPVLFLIYICTLC
jgi:predicted RND superfamily exporter protein